MNSPDSLLLQAQALSKSGQLPRARLICEEILQAQPDRVDVLHLSGTISARLGNPAEAADLLRRALEIDPGHAGVQFDLGNVLRKLGQFESALSCYDQAIRLAPRADVYVNRGLALKEMGQHTLAIGSFDLALDLDPGFMPAHANRGISLAALNQHGPALACFDQAILLAPQISLLHGHRGISLHALGRHQEAAQSYRQALALDPGNAEAHRNLGITLISLKQHESAIASLDQAIRLKPDFADAHFNRGLARHELGEHGTALADYGQAIKLQPNLRVAHRNISHLYLQLGQYDKGWEIFEWRLRTDDSQDWPSQFPQPRWRGRDSLANTTILLHSEQGLGDTIQFCRYAQLVANLGARVVLEVQPPLINLLSGLDGVTALATKGRPLPQFQFHCPLMSLPLAFGTRIDNIPFPGGYIRPDHHAVRKWQARLGTKTRPRIGLVWSGNPMHKNDLNRSVPLAEFIRLLDCNCEFICLQKEIRPEDRMILDAHPDIRHFETELSDFSDTAALCANLNLIISADTSVAHLAGAMGMPVWILLPYNPDWRWLLARADSPWYDSARLYRNDRLNGWPETLARVKDDLVRFLH